jgi:hypothetical protein
VPTPSVVNRGLAKRRSGGATPSPLIPRRDQRENPRRLRPRRISTTETCRARVVDTARLVGIALYLPRLALEEVRAVRPDAAPLLADLLSHPSVVLGEIDSATAYQVDQLLLAADVFHALAAHVVYVARQRGWPALSADPGRLRRIYAALEIDLL